MCLREPARRRISRPRQWYRHLLRIRRDRSLKIKSKGRVGGTQRARGPKEGQVDGEVQKKRALSMRSGPWTLSAITNCDFGSRTRCCGCEHGHVINCNVVAAWPVDFFHELFACQGGLMETYGKAVATFERMRSNATRAAYVCIPIHTRNAAGEPQRSPVCATHGSNTDEKFPFQLGI